MSGSSSAIAGRRCMMRFWSYRRDRANLAGRSDIGHVLALDARGRFADNRVNQGEEIRVNPRRRDDDRSC